MKSKPVSLLAQSEARCGASGKLCNNADGLIWSTEGRFSPPAGLRCGSLVVNQTTAGTAPCQRTQKTGQTILPKKERL